MIGPGSNPSSMTPSRPRTRRRQSGGLTRGRSAGAEANSISTPGDPVLAARACKTYCSSLCSGLQSSRSTSCPLRAPSDLVVSPRPSGGMTLQIGGCMRVRTGTEPRDARIELGEKKADCEGDACFEAT